MKKNPNPLKWYQKVDRKNPHQISFTLLPQKVQRTFSDLGESITFRDECLRVVDQLKAIVKSDRVEATDLKTRFSQEDWDYVVSAIADIPAEVRDVLAPANEVVVVRQSEAMRTATIAELMAAFIKKKKKDNPRCVHDKHDYWVNTSPIRNMRWSNITVDDIEKEQRRLVKTRLPQTANKITGALKLAFEYGVKRYRGIRTDNPFLEAGTLTPDPVMHTTNYTREQGWANVLAGYEMDEQAKKNVGPSGALMQRTFLNCGPLAELFFHTGIRAQFGRTMETKHVHLNEQYPFFLMPMKRGRLQEVPLAPGAIDLIVRQLDKPEVQASGILFPIMDRHGNNPQFVTKSWSKRYKKGLLERGLFVSEKPLHGFRSLAATYYRDKGFDLPEIADILGIDEESAKGYIHKTKTQFNTLAEKMNRISEAEKPLQRPGQANLRAV